jgi:hypothetical protein
MNYYNPSLAFAIHHHKKGHHKGKKGGRGKHHGHDKKKIIRHVMDSSQISLINAHNQKIQDRERTHHNILSRRSTKGHPNRNPNRFDNLLPPDSKDPTTPAKYKHNVSDSDKKAESADTIDISHRKGQPGVASNDELANYAYSYHNSNYLPIIILAGVTGLLLFLSLNKFKLNI